MGAIPSVCDNPRILVLRGGALGDFVLTLPVFQTLRTLWPAARIEMVGYPRIARLAVLGGWADAVRSLDEACMAALFADKGELSAELRRYIGSFDLVLAYVPDPDGVLRQNLLAAGARQVLSASVAVRDQHAVEQFLGPLRAAGWNVPEGLAPELRLSGAARARGRRRAGVGATPYVVFHPGSGSLKKNWPLANFLALAQEVQQRGRIPVFLAGEADAAIAAFLRAGGLPPGARLLEGLSVEQLAEVLAAAVTCVGNDSGVPHLAAAVGSAVVAIFGPTDPALWAPRGPCVRIVAPGPDSPGDLAAIPVSRVSAALDAVLACGD